MKQRSLSLFTCIVCTVSAFSQDLAQYELKVPVKSMTEKSYRAELKGKSWMPGMHAWYDETQFDNVVRFDEKGRVASTAYLTDDGTEYQEENYEYNGDKLFHLHSWYNEAEYQYDANGELTAVFSHGHGIGTNQFFINTNGKPAEIWSVSTEGDTLSHEKLEYDAKGHLLKQYTVPFTSGEYFLSEINYTYDAAGHVIQRSFRNDYELTVYDMIYTKGRLASQTMNHYMDGMLIESEEWLFDKKGFLVSKKKYEMIDPLAVNKLELTQTHTFKYTADKKGNWTKAVMTVALPGGEEHYVIEREIRYF